MRRSVGSDDSWCKPDARWCDCGVEVCGSALPKCGWLEHLEERAAQVCELGEQWCERAVPWCESARGTIKSVLIWCESDVHRIMRNAGPRLPAVALRTIYGAPTEAAAVQALDVFAAGPWGARYEAIALLSWRHWEYLSPAFRYPPAIRRLLYTAIDSPPMPEVTIRPHTQKNG